MDQRQLASVLFAVVGVLIAASRLPEILFHAGILAQWSPANENPTDPVAQRSIALLGLSSSLLAVLIGSGLVLLRNRLADRLFPPESGPLGAREFQGR